MELIFFGALVVAGCAIRAQLKPFTRSCGRCDGRGVLVDKSGKNYTPCPKCGGSPERLRAGAWLQLKLGIPVPRTRRPNRRRRMSL